MVVLVVVLVVVLATAGASANATAATMMVVMVVMTTGHAIGTRCGGQHRYPTKSDRGRCKERPELRDVLPHSDTPFVAITPSRTAPISTEAQPPLLQRHNAPSFAAASLTAFAAARKRTLGYLLAEDPGVQPPQRPKARSQVVLRTASVTASMTRPC
jgi:hypothetical protein